MKNLKYTLLLLGLCGCNLANREAPPVHSKDDIETVQKFKFHDRVSIKFKFLGTCTGIVNNAPYWAGYCGQDDTAQWVYFFGSVICDGEKRTGETYAGCERDMKLLKHHAHN